MTDQESYEYEVARNSLPVLCAMCVKGCKQVLDYPTVSQQSCFRFYGQEKFHPLLRRVDWSNFGLLLWGKDFKNHLLKFHKEV